MSPIDRIVTIIDNSHEPRKHLHGYGGESGHHEGYQSGMWVGEGNNRRFIPAAKPCKYAVDDDCDNCPFPDRCHFKRRV